MIEERQTGGMIEEKQSDGGMIEERQTGGMIEERQTDGGMIEERQTDGGIIEERQADGELRVWKMKPMSKCLKAALFLMASRGQGATPQVAKTSLIVW